MAKYVVIIAFIGFVFQLKAQLGQGVIENTDTIDYKSIVINYLNEYPPANKKDSVFIQSFKYLDNITIADSNKQCFEHIKQLLLSNKPKHEIKKLWQFRNKVDSLNKIRHEILTDYWNRQSLQNMADTGDVSSMDSLFFDMLDALTYQDTINIDSILQVLNPYNDTLLLAIDKVINSFNKSSLVQWIEKMRNDTINIYLVNINGDSLLVRLYEDNPFLIRFGLTDYWGTKIPAVIRDVEKRSFKILIDDTRELDYQPDEKAKEAMGQFGGMEKERNLTLTTIPYKKQKPIWIIGGNTNIDMSQVGLYQWAQGGDPSVSILTGLELFANYEKDKINWDNKGKFRYGVIRQGRYKKDSTAQFRSNEDRIELSTKYGIKVFSNYYASVEGDFKSQFTSTYDWDGNTKGKKISDFMSPAYIILSLGLDYKPNKHTSLFLSPITTKTTFVMDASADIKRRYSVDTTMNNRRELGARIKGLHKIKLWGDIELKNSFELFSNYLLNPQNIDVNWEMNIVFPVNDFIRATISTHLIYDDDTSVPKYRVNDAGQEEKYEGKGVQFREMITIGFAMKF